MTQSSISILERVERLTATIPDWSSFVDGSTQSMVTSPSAAIWNCSDWKEITDLEKYYAV